MVGRAAEAINSRGISSVGRASGWQPEGQGFKSPILHFLKPLASNRRWLFSLKVRRPVIIQWLGLSCLYPSQRLRDVKHDRDLHDFWASNVIRAASGFRERIDVALAVAGVTAAIGLQFANLTRDSKNAVRRADDATAV